MKTIRLSPIALLLSTILVGGPISAFADETRLVITEGEIQFVADEDGELIVIPPVGPEGGGPDVELEPEIPGTTGPLSIMKAATISFGSQVISNQDQTYSMVAELQPLKETGELVPYVSFAQVQDLRGTNAGWDLKVSVSDFKSDTQNNVLSGAEITFVDSMVRYEGLNQNNAPTGHTKGLKLIPNVGSVSVMTAETGKGAGSSSIVWGNQTNLNEQFSSSNVEVVTNNAIQLSVPGSTAKDATSYEAKLTWELITTPEEDVEDGEDGGDDVDNTVVTNRNI
ncbi:MULTISPECIES: WxL domain-containing protein [unclassified Enterococcus]|uniref:WxL domain-containing protein n=1 Tax=unclassified Enterococcus TaxID=2608891 RepID=UPI001A9B9A2B|nr:WxL domain-containing protein [Enterococcus sp. DIV1271a]MBO1300680.1 WxL domain-containing protein [Enterococcus sp. DIV1271a]